MSLRSNVLIGKTLNLECGNLRVLFMTTAASSIKITGAEIHQ